MTFDEKIEKINSDRILMLDMVKKNIAKNNIELSEKIDLIMQTLEYDDKNVKEYKSIIKSKQLIFELTEEIIKATNLEDIIKLRKKINYYINKIKKEIIRRNVNSEKFLEMFNQVISLRKNIAMLIRFLKKEPEREKIEIMHKNIKDLSQEDIFMLKKAVGNELKYNKRNISSMTGSQAPKSPKTSLPPKKVEEKEKLSATKVEINSNLKTDKRDELGDILFLNILNNLEFPVANSEVVEFLESESSLGEKYLEERIELYSSQYHFSKLYSYDNEFLKNFINFLKNILKYRRNKKLIKLAEMDYNTFYHGEDLAGFISFSKKRNSIINALTMIFARSRLSEREIECLNNHNMCKDWIIEFYSQEKEDKTKLKLTRTN